MKFGKSLETDLRDLPEDWRQYVLRYKDLKKQIRAVVSELEAKGLHLGPGEVQAVLDCAAGINPPPSQSTATSTTTTIAHPNGSALYSLEEVDGELIVTLRLQSPDGKLSQPFASLSVPSSPTSRRHTPPPPSHDHLQPHSPPPSSPELTLVDDEEEEEEEEENVAKVITSSPPFPPLEEGSTSPIPKHDSPPLLLIDQPSSTKEVKAPTQGHEGTPSPPTLNNKEVKDGSDTASSPLNQSSLSPGESVTPHQNIKESQGGEQDGEEEEDEEVMVPLEQDAEFFASLHSQIHDADAFCDRTKTKFVSRVDSLASTLTVAASPKDKDMYVWREIIRTFLETDIWMEDTPEGRRERSAPEALQAFHQLRHHLLKLGTVQSLRLAASRDAYIHFVQMVEELVAVKRFQELNALAMRKILKKHDKRTHLQAQATFPNLLLADSFFVQDVARTIAATISDRIIPIVPQLDDYLCPVCYSLFWKPVRLSCSHVFCVRCLVKAQRRELNDCPVCREPMAVVQAHADNMDASLLNLLELYFPRELKEKRKESEREVALEEAALIRSSQNLYARPRTSRRDGEEGCIIM